MQKIMLSEKQIQQQIIQYLQYQENAGKVLFIRNNSFAGKITRRNGSEGYVCNRKAGSPDILIFLTTNKKFATIGLEVKSEKGCQTKLQLEFEEKFNKLGGMYIVVRSIDDVEKIINYAFTKDLYNLPKDFLC